MAAKMSRISKDSIEVLWSCSVCVCWSDNSQNVEPML